MKIFKSTFLLFIASILLLSVTASNYLTQASSSPLSFVPRSSSITSATTTTKQQQQGCNHEQNLTPFLLSSSSSKDQILSCRGGGSGRPKGGRGSTNNNNYNDYDDDEEEYDEYDDDDDDEYAYDDDVEGEEEEPYVRRRPSRDSRRRPQQPQHPPRRRPPQQQQRNGRGRRPDQPSRRRSSSSAATTTSKIFKTTTDIAQKSINMATSATVSTVKNSGRAAYYLAAPKYVQKQEIVGIWRFDQILNDSAEACAANIEFTFKGDVITRYDGDGDQKEEQITGYLFQSRSWPRSCCIEFEANAFQGVHDEKPVRYYYKGYFRRKMADKSVIKIVGKIYEVKKRFWKGKDGPGVAGEEVGTFVARKRMKVVNHNQAEDEIEDYDDYDDFYDDEYDVEFEDEYDD